MQTVAQTGCDFSEKGKNGDIFLVTAMQGIDVRSAFNFNICVSAMRQEISVADDFKCSKYPYFREHGLDCGLHQV